MKLARSLVAVLLLLFVGATVGLLIAQEATRPESQAKAGDAVSRPLDETASDAGLSAGGTSVSDASGVGAGAQPPAADSDGATTSGEDQGFEASLGSVSEGAGPPCVVEVTYFHNTNRCATCLKIERSAKAIVETQFADQVASGSLRWAAINMEAERAYISQYGLVAPSLVLICKAGDDVVHWVTLTETWSLIGSPTRYSAYIVERFSDFLEACP